MDTRPRCPRCGEPARYAIVVARVRFALNPDGKHTRIDRADPIEDSGDWVQTPDGRRVSRAEWECGGGHRWKTKGVE